MPSVLYIYIFFQDLGKAIRQAKIHVFVQVFTFIFFPVLISCLVPVLRIGFVNKNILEG